MYSFDVSFADCKCAVLERGQIFQFYQINSKSIFVAQEHTLLGHNQYNI